MLTADDFDELFRNHHQRLVKTALDRLGGNPHDADDATAEAWAQAWEQRDTWDPGRGVPPLGWLLTLLRYTCLAVVRDRRALADPDHDTTAPDEKDRTPSLPGLTDPLTHQAWARVWPTMAEREATAVWLRCVGGYSSQEAADILGVDPHTIVSLTAAGLRKIEQFFRNGPASSATSCKRCGYRPMSLGHRTLCQQKQEQRNINSRSRWPVNGAKRDGGRDDKQDRRGGEAT